MNLSRLSGWGCRNDRTAIGKLAESATSKNSRTWQGITSTPLREPTRSTGCCAPRAENGLALAALPCHCSHGSMKPRASSTRKFRLTTFARQPLLPNKMSEQGPTMAWADVDGDGDTDCFLGRRARAAGPIDHQRWPKNSSNCDQLPAFEADRKR